MNQSQRPYRCKLQPEKWITDKIQENRTKTEQIVTERLRNLGATEFRPLVEFKTPHESYEESPHSKLNRANG